MEKKPAATCHFTDASQAARGLGPNRCLWLRPGPGGVSRDSDSDNQRHETEQKRTNYIRVGEALTVPRQRASGRRTCWYSHMARLVSTQDTLSISAQAKTRLGLSRLCSAFAAGGGLANPSRLSESQRGKKGNGKPRGSALKPGHPNELCLSRRLRRWR